MVVQYSTIEKQKRVACLILRRRAHLSMHGKVSKESRDLILTHAFQVSPPVKKHKPPHPITIGLLRSDAVVQSTHPAAQLLENSVFLCAITLAGKGGRRDEELGTFHPSRYIPHPPRANQNLRPLIIQTRAM